MDTCLDCMSHKSSFRVHLRGGFVFVGESYEEG